MQKNFAQLTLKFDTLLVEKTTLNPKYDLVTATSAVGGLLGLLIGGSLVTLFELLEMLFLFFRILVINLQFPRVKRLMSLRSIKR